MVEVVVYLLVGWSLVYLLLHGEVLPGGDLWRILVLVLVAQAVGWFFELLRLPALLGMLLIGVAFRSLGFFRISGIYREIVVVSREVALAVILIKAGLGLDAGVLKKMSVQVVKLSLVPCFAEAVAAAIASHFLVGMPWFWAFLLGFLLSPVSPAVVVPSLLTLKEKGYGESKGIPTLVIAAASLDDIASISLFGIFLAMIFSQQGNLTLTIIHGPLELIIGLSIGILWGFVSSVLPHRDDKHSAVKRAIMVGAGGLLTILGSRELGFDGAGPLACITATFIAGVAWKSQNPFEFDDPVSEVYSGVWLVMQPILFGLIGTEIDLNQLELTMVGSGLAVIAICLVVRIITCFAVLTNGKLNWKEILFVNLAWLPKATVQAALSPQALDIVRSRRLPSGEDLERASFVVTTAILAILVTAPLGSVAINLSGPRLLAKEEVPNEADVTDTRL